MKKGGRVSELTFTLSGQSLEHSPLSTGRMRERERERKEESGEEREGERISYLVIILILFLIICPLSVIPECIEEHAEKNAREITLTP